MAAGAFSAPDPAPPAWSLEQQLAALREALPAGSRLLAVSKGHPAASLRQLAALGQRSFGESRLQEAIAKQAELAAKSVEFDGFKQQAEGWKTIAAEAERWKGEHAKLTATIAEERVFVQHGITDPEVQEAVRWSYGRLPSEGRPELGDAVKSWKEKPETAPTILRPHIAPAAKEAPQPTGSRLPPSNRGAAASPAGTQGMLQPAAVLSGANDAAILAALGRKA